MWLMPDEAIEFRVKFFLSKQKLISQLPLPSNHLPIKRERSRPSELSVAIEEGTGKST